MKELNSKTQADDAPSSAVPTNSRRVLIFFLGVIGDSIVAIPVLRAIRDREKGSTLELLHERHPSLPFSAESVLGGLRLLDRIWSYDVVVGRWPKLREAVITLKRIRRRNYDRIYYLAPSRRTRSAVRRDRIFFRLCGIPELIGFSPFPESVLRPRREDNLPVRISHESHLHFARIGLSRGRPTDAFFDLPLIEPRDVHFQVVDKFLSLLPKGHVLVAIAPGSKSAATRWPIERFEELGHWLIRTYGVIPIVVGGPAEQEIAAQLISAWGAGLNAAGGFSLPETAALLTRCALYIGVDTGTSHLASAVSVPAVVLFSGRSWPGQWEPLGTNVAVLQNPTPCQGCGLTDCPIPDHPCMTGINIEEVKTAVAKALANSASGSAQGGAPTDQPGVNSNPRSN